MFEAPTSMDEVADLMRENLPHGMTPAEFGQRMKWGRGSDEAQQRIDSLSVEELHKIGLSAEQATNWAVAYDAVLPPNAAKPERSRAGVPFATRGSIVGWRMRMPPISASNATQVVRIRNTTGAAQELWLEPLGDRVILAPNVLYELAATDALEEIDLSVDGFTVYGWVIRVSAIEEGGGMQTVWELPSELS
jgi:hypothetical protein